MDDVISDKAVKELLELITGFGGDFSCAHSIRIDGHVAKSSSNEMVRIVSKPGSKGLDIYISSSCRGERVIIPACIVSAGVDEEVFNDFHVEAGADVEIVAGCGIHAGHDGGMARHSGIHSFHLEPGSRARYVEKHVGTGRSEMKKIMAPVTNIILEEGSCLEMDTSQISGIDDTERKTYARLDRNARLVIKEHILTDGTQIARTDFKVELVGDGSSSDVVSRSVAKDDSRQYYQSHIIGASCCTGHSECDAMISGRGQVYASPALDALSEDADLIHEAAIGKIAGEQILKLQTLGLSEEEAVNLIIDGFLR